MLRCTLRLFVVRIFRTQQIFMLQKVEASLLSATGKFVAHGGGITANKQSQSSCNVTCYCYDTSYKKILPFYLSLKMVLQGTSFDVTLLH